MKTELWLYVLEADEIPHLLNYIIFRTNNNFSVVHLGLLRVFSLLHKTKYKGFHTPLYYAY